MDLKSIPHNKKRNFLALDFNKPIKCHSENNDNEDNENYNHNLFKGIVKVKIKKGDDFNQSMIKKSPETKSNTNYNNNIYDFTNYLYNKEEHLNKNLRISNINSIVSPKSPGRHIKRSDKSKSSRELMILTKGTSLRKRIIHSNSNRLMAFSSIKKVNDSLGSKLRQGDMSCKNRNILLNFPFKMIEKHKEEPNKKYVSPYGKMNSVISLKKYSFKNNINIKISSKNNFSNDISKINEEEKEKEEKEKGQKALKQEQLDKQLKEKIKKEIEESKKKKTNIIISKLSRPFLCCLKW